MSKKYQTLFWSFYFFLPVNSDDLIFFQYLKIFKRLRQSKFICFCEIFFEHLNVGLFLWSKIICHVSSRFQKSKNTFFRYFCGLRVFHVATLQTYSNFSNTVHVIICSAWFYFVEAGYHKVNWKKFYNFFCICFANCKRPTVWNRACVDIQKCLG